MQMTYELMMTFAELLDRCLEKTGHRSRAGTFCRGSSVQAQSPASSSGRPVLQNKKELEGYWRAALDRISTLDFKLDHATWDESRRELNVVYEANLNGERKRACEIMQFDASGRQIKGEALYGAVI